MHNKGQLDQNDPKAVASFLLQNADRLDKTIVGDYLGKEETYQDGFCVKVLHSYGEQMDFSGINAASVTVASMASRAARWHARRRRCDAVDATSYAVAAPHRHIQREGLTKRAPQASSST